MTGLYYDIKAFLILRKEIRKASKTPDWARFKLRHDWIYRVFTVINQNEGDRGDDDKMLEMKALDRINPINQYIASLGLAEIVSVSMERVPGTTSYLVVYYQIYRWFSLWNVIRSIAIISTVIWLVSTYWKSIQDFVKLFAGL
jgi:hypothetical protein